MADPASPASPHAPSTPPPRRSARGVLIFFAALAVGTIALLAFLLSGARASGSSTWLPPLKYVLDIHGPEHWEHAGRPIEVLRTYSVPTSQSVRVVVEVRCPVKPCDGLMNDATEAEFQAALAFVAEEAEARGVSGRHPLTRGGRLMIPHDLGVVAVQQAQERFRTAIYPLHSNPLAGVDAGTAGTSDDPVAPRARARPQPESDGGIR